MITTFYQITVEAMPGAYRPEFVKDLNAISRECQNCTVKGIFNQEEIIVKNNE